ncbi:hypothetical protein JCM10449v2_000701 [Rhodotorula kratochvilovae]
MSTAASASPSPAPTALSSASAAPPPSSTASPSTARPTPQKPKQASPTRKRKPLRRRGARADDEDESEVASSSAPPVADAGSDSDSDFAPSPDPDSDEDDDDEDDDEREGANTPRTPAEQQLPARGANGASKPVKAVLAGVDVHPSWSDAVDAAEEGDESVALPTLDFADLSLEAVQALPTSSASARAAEGDKPLSKKQIALQRREAKSAALKARDPAEWEKREKEHQEREEAKRVAKKERQKEKRREKKAAEKAGAPVAASTSAPAPAAASPAAPAPAARPAKPSRPVVPSRPSRTGLALGLVNPASPSQPAAAAPAASTSTAPVVPAATRQPAFLPRDAQGRPVPQPFAPRGRGRGRGGFAVVTGRWGAPAQDEPDKAGASTTPAAWGHSGFDELEAERGVRGSARGRGRGAAFAVGRGGAHLQSGINPRFAHLPFHPSHRFHPAAQPKTAAAPPVSAPEPIAPEATTAAPDDELFREEDAPAKDVVKLPDGGAAQVSLAVKGAAARAAEEQLAEKENTPPLQQQAPPAPVDADAELRKQQGASILYAADPARIANGAAPAELPPVSFALYEQQLPEMSAPLAPFPHQVPTASSFMHQVPPHLQQSPAAVQASYIPRHSSPAYYAPPHAYYPDPSAMAPSPGATPTPPPPFGAIAHTPTSAYFLPPRPNKRVEIKAPSRDGQSPVPLKSAGPAPPDAFEAAQQARIAQLVREAEERQHHYMHAQAQAQAHSDAATAGSSSPASTRAAFLPGGSPVVQQQQAFAPSPYYPGAGGGAPPPASAPMFSTYTHSSHGSFDGAGAPPPFPPASGEQYAPFPPPHPHQHPLAQQQQAFYPSHHAAQLQHPFQQLYDPYAAAAMQAQYYGAPPPPPPPHQQQPVDGQRWTPY